MSKADVIQLNNNRPGMIKTLMTDIGIKQATILGVENGTNELIMARTIGDASKMIESCIAGEGLTDTNKVLAIYNNSDDGTWKTLRLEAYLSNEIIDLILN